MPSSNGDRPDKAQCFVCFDEVAYWHSRMRGLITDASSHSYLAFRQSFLEVRRETRVAEFALVAALYHFKNQMEEEPNDCFEKQ